MAKAATATLQADPVAPEVVPNLRPVSFGVSFHLDHKQFDVTLFVKNDGDAPALGSFQITFGYSYYDYSQDPPLFEYHERVVTTPGSTDVQPGGTNPFKFANIAYVRKPGTTMAPYTFYALVDSAGQVPESNEGDNMLTRDALIRPPLVDRPDIDESMSPR